MRDQVEAKRFRNMRWKKGGDDEEVEAAEESHNGALQGKKSRPRNREKDRIWPQNFWDDYLPTCLSHPSLFSSFALFGKMSL